MPIKENSTQVFVRISFLFAVLLFAGNLQSQDFKYLIGKATESADSSAIYFNLAKRQIRSASEKAIFALAKSTYYNDLGNTDSTVHYALEASEIADGLDSTSIKIAAYKNICRVYRNAGDYAQSSEYGVKALRIVEQKKDLLGISWFNNLLSLNHHDFEHYEKGVEYGKIAFETALKAKPKESTLITYPLNSIAINFDDWKKPDSALFYHYKILDYVEGADTINYYFTYNNIGNTLIKLNKLDEAEQWLNRSLNSLNLAAKETDSTELYYDYATTLINLSTIAFRKKQFEKAETLFDKTGHYVEKTGNAEKKRDYYYQRYLYNKERNNSPEMAKYQELYILLRDSVFNTERAKAFADLERKYQTEKKTAEIKILSSENKRQKNILLFTLSGILMAAAIGYLLFNRRRLQEKADLQQQFIVQQDEAAKAVITAEETERQRMSATLHDGLGQMLSVVKMNLQSIAVKTEGNEAVAPVMNKTLDLMDASIKEMREVSHQFATTNVVRFGLSAALKDLVDKIDQKHLEITLEMNGPVNETDPEIQLVIYRIFQECINNVIKHSKASNLEIVLQAEKNQIFGRVKDNGIGFAYNGGGPYHGIGLENILTRIKFLKGTASIDSVPGSGTSISFKIPTNPVI